MIIECNCRHKVQDELHGWQLRVHNPMKLATKDSRQRYRCTVCGKEREKNGIV